MFAGVPVATPSATVALAEWSSLRLEQVSTPAGELVEYRPTSDVVSVATGATRTIDFTGPDAPLQRFEVTPGQVHIFPANVPVGIRLFGPAESLVVTLSQGLLCQGRHNRTDLPVELRSVFGLQDALIEQLVYALREAAQSDRGDGQYIRTLSAALAAHLARKYARDTGHRSTHPRHVVSPSLLSVQDYIEQHLDGRLTLPELAAVARLSVFAFVRSFKTATGVPPHRYILRKRVERAKVLLGDAALSIADVALRCGFGDQSAFTTTFRRLTRQTPSSYRDTLG